MAGDGAFRAIRNLIVIAEEQSAATIVEESCGPADGARGSLNEVTELFAGPDSQIRYVPLQRLGRERDVAPDVPRAAAIATPG